MSTCGIFIPARIESTRFPGKPLVELPNGRTLLKVVADNAKESGMPYFVVTPDREISEFCDDYHVPCIFYKNYVSTGTDRAAIAHEYLGEPWDKVIVLQCDEPDVTGDYLTALAGDDDDGSCAMVCTGADPHCPHHVKAILADDKYIQGFVRWHDSCTNRHVGVYSYGAVELNKYRKYSRVRSRTEMIQSLEQLRLVLTSDLRWKYLYVRPNLRSVNVPSDIDNFKEPK